MEKEFQDSKEEVDKTLKRIEEDTEKQGDSPRNEALKKMDNEIIDFLLSSSDPLLKAMGEKELKRNSESEQGNKQNELPGKPEETEDLIKKWEKNNKNYDFENIDPDHVIIENATQRDVSFEFIDHLVGNALPILKEHAISSHIVKVRIIAIGEDGSAVGIELENVKNETFFLFFVAPDFRLKILNNQTIF